MGPAGRPQCPASGVCAGCVRETDLCVLQLPRSQPVWPTLRCSCNVEQIFAKRQATLPAMRGAALPRRLAVSAEVPAQRRWEGRCVSPALANIAGKIALSTVLLRARTMFCSLVTLCSSTQRSQLSAVRCCGCALRCCSCSGMCSNANIAKSTHILFLS